MAKKATGWTDYAVLQSSAGGKEWKVQRNAEGLWRCSCPAFIFQRQPLELKNCKHTRLCQRDLALGATIPLAPVGQVNVVTPAVRANVLVAGFGIQRPALAPCWDSAAEMVTAMLTRASVGTSLTASKVQILTDVLASRLQVFNPAAASVPVPTAAASPHHGVRKIVFDEAEA